MTYVGHISIFVGDGVRKAQVYASKHRQPYIESTSHELSTESIFVRI